MGHAAPTRPTSIRYRVIAVTTLMSFVLYLHRFFLSFIERFLKEDLDLSNDQIAWLFSMFFVAYGIGQVPGGWLADRFGSRKTLAVCILLWSIFTGLIGIVSLFAAIVALRFVFGLAQAGAYPTSSSMISKWVPFSSRGFASSCVAAGGRVGGAAAPIVTGWLLILFVPITTSSLLRPGELQDVAALWRHFHTDEDVATRELSGQLLKAEESVTDEPQALVILNAAIQQGSLPQYIDVANFKLEREATRLLRVAANQRTPVQVERLNRLILEAAYPEYIRKIYRLGWRRVIFVYGIVGVVVAAIFWWIVRDSPHVHPRANATERKLIDGDLPKEAADPHGKVAALPWRAILTNRSLWFSSMSQLSAVFSQLFLMTWFARYLAEEHQVPVMQRAGMISLAITVGMSGMIVGGWWTDWFAGHFGLRWGRSLPMAIARFVAMMAMACCLWLDSAWGVVVALAVTAFTNDLGVPAVWAYNQDVGGRYAGSILGWGNMWGCVGAFLSPIVLNRIIEDYGWDAMFIACAIAFFVAGATALGVDARSTIQPPEGAKPPGVD